MGFGLALSGGGTRGATHVGVLLALQEASFLPRSLAGTSAGAIVGGLYAAGVEPLMLKQMVYHLVHNGKQLMDVDYIGILRGVYQLVTRRELTLTGLMKGEKMYDFISHYTSGKTMRDVSLPIVIPAVDMASARTVVYTNRAAGKPAITDVIWRDDVLLAEACCASAAVPIAFRPRKSGKLMLLDGGLTDNLPVSLLAAAGETNILAVDISEDYEPPEDENIIEIASHSLSIMGRRLRQCSSTGERVLLKPKLPDNAKFLDFSHMTRCMQAGYEATKNMLPVLRTMLV